MYNCVIIIIGQKAVPTNTDGPTNKDREHGSTDNKVQLVVGELLFVGHLTIGDSLFHIVF